MGRTDRDRTDRLDSLVPPGVRTAAERLRALDADPLARYVSDAENPWHRRRNGALALAGRVPEQRVPALSP